MILYEIFFSLDRLVTKNQSLNTKCQPKFFVVVSFEMREDSLKSKEQKGLQIDSLISFLISNETPSSLEIRSANFNT